MIKIYLIYTEYKEIQITKYKEYKEIQISNQTKENSTYHYIPFLDNLKNLLSNSQLFEEYINNNNPKNKTIITCCASGMRSGSAKQILISNGYTVQNGGGWSSLSGKI